MKSYPWIGLALATGIAAAAQAQSTSITAGPDGALSGSVSVPGLEPMSVQAGNGEASVSPPVSAGAAAPGRSVTVRSADGSAVSSAWTSDSNGVVAGAGSPGSRVTTTPPPHRATAPPARKRTLARACPRGASRAYIARTHCRQVAAAASKTRRR